MIKKQTENVQINHLWFPKQDIVDNDYDLSINKYKEVEYVKVEYPPTSEIMANIREIEAEIGREMDELERLLNE